MGTDVIMVLQLRSSIGTDVFMVLQPRSSIYAK